MVNAAHKDALIEEYRKYCGADAQSPRWRLTCRLIEREICYDTGSPRVPRRKFSPHECAGRSVENWGGDRMLINRYAYGYAKYLPNILNKDDDSAVVEVGILHGTGLAALADLFPNNPVYGFDLDLSYIEASMAGLKAQGAFASNTPRLIEYDQFIDNSLNLETMLVGNKVKYVVDDGYHSDETALMTLHSFHAHLADNFVYVIEDNHTVHTEIASKYPQFSVHRIARVPGLTILTPKDI